MRARLRRWLGLGDDQFLMMELGALRTDWRLSEERIAALEAEPAKSPATAAGEPEKSTTPTCGSTDDGKSEPHRAEVLQGAYRRRK